MKRTLKAAVSAIICIALLTSCLCIPAFSLSPEAAVPDAFEQYLADGVESAAEADTQTKISFINRLSNFLLNDVVFGLIARLIPDGANVISSRKFKLDDCKDFYSGNGEFKDTSSTDGKWSVGYGQESILPSDFGTKKYARGSYVPYWVSTEIYSDEDGNPEDLKVRVVILDDGTGRGSAVFAVIDCIGYANADVRLIRTAIADFAAEHNIKSVNVSATHTHTGIDSQGVWTSPISTMAHNFMSAITCNLIKQKNGIDETFRQTVTASAVRAIKEAYADMTEGELFYAKADIAEYMYDRTPPYAYDGNLYRLCFNPDDSSKTPTLIATFGCHPESGSYDWLQKTDSGLVLDTKITADFVYYMEKVANKAGYNFIYIQGNVGTVSSKRSKSDDGLSLDAHQTAMRFGYELGYIALGLTLTPAECVTLNSDTGDLLGVAKYGGSDKYTPWYANHKAVSEVAVEPVLNIRHEQFTIEVENNVALILSKTALASINLIHDRLACKYYTVTEIGYMEIGSALKVFLSPGEVMGELLIGGDCLADFPYDGLREVFGDNLIICDLMNDAAGYVEPDNYYVIAGYQYDPATGKAESDTWCMLVSLGKATASTVIGKFISLVNGTK